MLAKDLSAYLAGFNLYQVSGISITIIFRGSYLMDIKYAYKGSSTQGIE